MFLLFYKEEGNMDEDKVVDIVVDDIDYMTTEQLDERDEVNNVLKEFNL